MERNAGIDDGGITSREMPAGGDPFMSTTDISQQRVQPKRTWGYPTDDPEDNRGDANFRDDENNPVGFDDQKGSEDDSWFQKTRYPDGTSHHDKQIVTVPQDEEVEDGKTASLEITAERLKKGKVIYILADVVMETEALPPGLEGPEGDEYFQTEEGHSGMSVTELPDGSLMLEWISTLPEARGMGLAQELIRYLQQMGRTIYTLPINEPSEALNSKMGFKPLGRKAPAGLENYVDADTWVWKPSKQAATDSKERPVCPNCGQWQSPPTQYTPKELWYLDCFNDCAERGFAEKVPARPQVQPSSPGGVGIDDVPVADVQKEQDRLLDALQKGEINMADFEHKLKRLQAARAKRICSYCWKDLGQTERDDYKEGAVTDGICPECEKLVEADPNYKGKGPRSKQAGSIDLLNAPTRLPGSDKLPLKKSVPSDEGGAIGIDEGTGDSQHVVDPDEDEKPVDNFKSSHPASNSVRDWRATTSARQIGTFRFGSVEIFCPAEDELDF